SPARPACPRTGSPGPRSRRSRPSSPTTPPLRATPACSAYRPTSSTASTCSGARTASIWARARSRAGRRPDGSSALRILLLRAPTAPARPVAAQAALVLRLLARLHPPILEPSLLLELGAVLEFSLVATS